MQRYAIGTFRPKQLGIYITIYVVSLFLLILVNENSRTSEPLFYQFSIFQMILLWFVSARNTASAIHGEVQNNAYDFFRMLPLTPSQKAIGILLGKNALLLIFVLINMIFWLGFGVSSKISVTLIAYMFLGLVSVSILVNNIALLVSIQRRKKTRSAGALLLIVIFFIASWVIGGVEYLFSRDDPAKTIIGFYDFDLPVFLFVSILALYFSIWAYAGSLRKIAKENVSIFNKGWACVFILGCEVIILGVFWPYIDSRYPKDVYFGFWLATMVPVLIVPFMSVTTFSKYYEYYSFIEKTTGKHPGKFQLFMNSNISLFVGMFLIWMLFVLGFSVKFDLQLNYLIRLVIVVFAIYMFICFLLEIYNVFVVDSEKIGFLLVFIGVLYFFLPLIFVVVFSWSPISLFSPLGFISEVLTEKVLSFGTLSMLKIYYGVVTGILGTIILKRYLVMLDVRRQMK